jgi:serine/threonine protein kinase/TPR repeat protein
MPTEALSVRAIFNRALEISDETERASYLDQACAAYPALRQEVEDLLKSHSEAGSFLQSLAAGLKATEHLPRSEQIGAHIGPYKLLQQIGEGGMGMVYMAQQERPVQRTVALKIIKPGMDSSQVIARFEAERQALSLMDHPNIAKVLDAGTTDTGRPYFVMELVKGVPIVQYADEHRLTPRQRLELFIPVCLAVQHAHQKGIIHRDLKPTNVLVANYDDHPVPKVIDFGLAKAIGQQLTEKTMFTRLGQIVGTIEYMSPEQAKFNQLDIDTRTDIYSLGVLLYELLIGETPFDRRRLRSAAFDEMLRIIREEDPPKPSTRLSSSGSLPSIAAQRHLEPKKLATLIAGDLDWIVMKSMEKDRARRYQTATGLADDLQRYLTDQPVEARRPTRAYRLKKFIRRNKLAFAAACGIAISLVIGLGTSSWMFLQEKQALARATDAEQRAKRLADKSQQVAGQFGHSLWQLGDALSTSGYPNEAEPILMKAATTFDQAVKDFPEVPFFRQEYANSERKLGEFLNSSGRLDQAENHFRTSIREYAALAKDLPENSFFAQEEAYANLLLADAFQTAGRHAEASELFRHAAEIHHKSAEKGDVTAQDRLGNQYFLGQGVGKDLVEALKWYRLAAKQGNPLSQMHVGMMYARGWGTNQDDAEAVRWYRLAADQNEPYGQIGLAGMYAHGRGVEKNEPEAAKLYRLAATHYLAPGGTHEDVQNLNRLAAVFSTGDVLSLRDPPLAVELAQKAVGIEPKNGELWKTLGAAQYRAGNWQAALIATNKSIELRRDGVGARDWFVLAMINWQLGDKERARSWYDKAVQWMKDHESKDQELQQFQDEASKLLKVEDQTPSSDGKTGTTDPQPSKPQ